MALAAVHPQVGASPLWAWLLCLTRFFSRRVHITEATLNHLDKAYEVEDGHGQQRDPYLKEMNIRTYLVIDPRVGGSDAAGGLAVLGRDPTRQGRALWREVVFSSGLWRGVEEAFSG